MIRVRREFLLSAETETHAISRVLAGVLQRGDCLALHGDLGAGKSTLIRGILRTLLPQLEEFPSPTFTLVNLYDSGPIPIHHCDAYRLEHPAEAEALGLDEALIEGIVLVEWPEILAGMLPEDTLHLFLAIEKESEVRRLAIEGDAVRWAALSTAVFPVHEVSI